MVYIPVRIKDVKKSFRFLLLHFADHLNIHVQLTKNEVYLFEIYFTHELTSSTSNVVLISKPSSLSF